MLKKIAIALILLSQSVYSTSHAYLFGIRAQDNDTAVIQELEQSYNIHIPLVSFIFDEFEEQDLDYLSRSVDILWNERIYHITLSPFWFTSAEVAKGAMDQKYRAFFQLIKNKKVKVLFRTMHEMNGGWYSWSSKPDSFRKAWRHVYKLSREEWLDSENIKFIFSVNSQDLPTNDELPSQSSPLIPCQFTIKLLKGCYTFEDYYPWDSYVDLMGITLYNWGRGVPYEWASWKTPQYLLNEPDWSTLGRLRNYKKKIVIDEIGTTSARYEGEYSSQKSRDAFLHDPSHKDEWLYELRSFLKLNPDIVAVSYFNVDKTYGLQHPVQWELDWAILNTSQWTKYSEGVKFFTDPKINNYSSFSKIFPGFGEKIVITKAKECLLRWKKSPSTETVNALKKEYYDSPNLLSKKSFVLFLKAKDRLEKSVKTF